MSQAPQAEPEPGRVTRLLSLVRKLIDYGGSWARLVSDIIRDRWHRLLALNGPPDRVWPGSPQPSPAPACTHPP